MTADTPRARIDAALDQINDNIVTVSPAIAATSKAHADRIRLYDALTAVVGILDEIDDDEPIETPDNVELLRTLDALREAIAARLEAAVEPTAEYGDIKL